MCSTRAYGSACAITAGIVLAGLADAQNLVSNGDFEQFTTCPSALDQISVATGWSTYLGTCDYYNACNEDTTGVPWNWFGYQPASSGVGYAGIYCFSDDDGNPLPALPGDDETVVVNPVVYPPPDDQNPRPRKFYVKERPVSVVLERVEYLDEAGKLVTESLRDYSRKTIRRHFTSLDQFLHRWRSAERKETVIAELAEEGLLLEPLQDEVGTELDPFDLICHIAFDQPPLSRRDRANNVIKRDVFTKYGPQARAVLEALLVKYRDEGVVSDLDNIKVLEIPPFSTMGTPLQLIKQFGSKAGFEQAVHELQNALYAPDQQQESA